MADLNVGHGTPAGPDALEEVGPELADVLVVRLVQVRVLVNGGFLRVGRGEGPAVEPAHVERPFRAVEITADAGLLRFVSGVEAMLPDGGKGFELEAGHLSVGRGRVVAEDAPAAGREHLARILLFR